MSLLGFEGFDDMSNFPEQLLGGGQWVNGTPTNGLGYWLATSGGATKNAGQLGGSALGLQTNGQYFVWFNNNYTRLIVGFRFRTGTSVVANSDLIAFGDGNSSIQTLVNQKAQLGLSINASNHLFVWGSNAIATVLGTGTTTLATGSWYYVEIDCTFNSSTGSVTVRLNGSGTEISASGNTGGSGNNRANMFIINPYTTNGITCWYDDMYLLDPTTGSSPFTSMLGVCRVETLFPTSNDVVAWTPQASTNVSRVQEVTIDGDTTYNSIASSGQDTFNIGSLVSTPVTIFATAVRASIRKDDVTGVSAQTTLKSGATTQQGVSFGQNSTYQTMRDIYVNDPNTGSPWIATNVNASKIGYNRI